LNAPVIPEKRKPLTRKQRVDAHDLHGGICCVCQEPIAPGEPFIDEHIIPLALGGSNDNSNRGMAHIPCAKIKTRRDQNMIAKAIRMRAKHLGIKKRGGRKLKSRGFSRVAR
jgi:5-methylcytosine-specific restriction protein A